MATKVFISWSGDRSRKLGEALSKWLPDVLQHVETYFTPIGIDKGANWNSGISTELESTDIGIVCLTPENLQAPWILFESGALSKNQKTALVCTLLLGLNPTDVEWPLAAFQSTVLNEDDVYKLVCDINKAGKDSPLTDERLKRSFDAHWPELLGIIEAIPSDEIAEQARPLRDDPEVLREILGLVRTISVRQEVHIPRPSFTGMGIGSLLSPAKKTDIGLARENPFFIHTPPADKSLFGMGVLRFPKSGTLGEFDLPPIPSPDELAEQEEKEPEGDQQ